MKDIQISINNHNGKVTITPPEGFRIVINPGLVADDEIISLAEASRQFGINRNTIYNWCRTRRLPYTIKGGVCMVKAGHVQHAKDNPLKPGRKRKG